VTISQFFTSVFRHISPHSTAFHRISPHSTALIFFITMTKRSDRYILRQVFATFSFGIIGLCVLFVIVHLLENLDGFLDKRTPLLHIVIFYVNFLPEIIKLITPIAMLLASLFTIGRLANTNEITAMKAGGMSLYRIMAPIALFGAVVSAAQVYFNGWIVPKANIQKATIERKYLGKSQRETTLYNLYLRDAPTRNVMIRYYDDHAKSGSFLSIEEYSSEMKPRMTRRVDAQYFNFDTTRNAWKMMQAMEHRFFITPSKFDTTVTTTHTAYYPKLNILPRDILQLQRGTEEMNFNELKTYIELSQRGGKDVRQQMIDYYGQYALPFANLIVTLFCVLPLAGAGGARKSGLALEIAAALVISFLYMACVKIGQTVALSSPMPPALGAWMANIVFALVGLVLVLRLRT
jgi:lipopolysaccharide export system permease protein